MGDLLSAASLLLAGVGVVYGAWYSELTRILETNIPQHLPDRRPVRRALSIAYKRRALPLAVFVGLTSLILFPDALACVLASFHEYTHDGLPRAPYDARATLFVTVGVPRKAREVPEGYER